MLRSTFFLSVANPSPSDLTRPPIGFSDGVFAGLGSVLICSEGPHVFVLWLQSLVGPSLLWWDPVCFPFALVPPFFFSLAWPLCVPLCGFPDEPLGAPFEDPPDGPPDGPLDAPLGGCPDEPLGAPVKDPPDGTPCGPFGGCPDEPLGAPFEGPPNGPLDGPPDGPLGGCPDGPPREDLFEEPFAPRFSTSARGRFGACSNHLCQREEVSRVCLCPTTTKPILALVRRTFSLQGSSE